MVAKRMPLIRAGARTNVALLALLVAAFLTGWLGFAYATAPARWSLALHAVSGFAILVLLPWKSMIARRGLKRPRPGRWASLLLGALVLVSLTAGLLHSSGLLVSLGAYTAMEVHVGAALLAVPLAVWHLTARRVRIRTTDISRRTFLKGATVAATATVAYGAGELAASVYRLPGAGRRFTGSYEAGSYRPDLMPTSSWMFDPVPQIDPATFSLRIGTKELSYDQLSAYDDRLTATLDCTGGFYSTQEWAGVRLDRLVDTQSGVSIRVVSHTGYDRRFPIEEASRLVLATRFGAQTLDPAHGFPVRLIAPARRGFWWVKWVVAIDVDDMPYWWQAPYPVQ